MKQFLFVAAICLLALVAQAQECPQLLPENTDQIKADIEYLADDALEGRAPGTAGADMAAEYIKARFEEMGIAPLDDDYFQHFDIPGEVIFGAQNQLVVKNQKASLRKDFYPVQYSSNASVKGETQYVKFGITAPGRDYDDYAKLKPADLEGKIFVMDISSPDGIHPHSAYLRHHDLGERIETAKKKGARAVILVNAEGMASDISPEFTKIRDKGLPVVFVVNDELAKKLRRKKEVEITTELREKRIDAKNVVARLNHDAEQSVVVGAHYDHLGMGGKSSLHRGEPAIHNGADDNASGVAGLLQIARHIKEHPENFVHYNFIFIAFSGEENGLLGSSHFTQRYEGGGMDIKYMLNLDMVGRLEENLLAVNGVGTSPAWEEIVKNPCNGLELKTSKSGVGPSDHTSFYHLNIPVLHFFTGTHKDYHRPSDDAELINFEGTARVVEYILSIIAKSNEYPEMEFSPTSLDESLKAVQFSVTLGVMPDYMYEGEGMRIEGVTEGKPAAKAGLKAGDVVVKLGEVKVVDMTSYMKALGQFKPGDASEVTYRRSGKTITSGVQF